MTTLPDRLKQLRAETNLLQKDIAKKLNITASAYGYYEQGKRIPDSNTLNELAKIFNVSLDYLMGASDVRTAIKSASIKMTKKEKISYDEFLETAKAFFMDASEEDRDAITRDISNLYWESKQINKQKYSPRDKKDSL